MSWAARAKIVRRAAGHSVDTEEWLAEFDTGFARIAGRFARVEPRRRARAFLLG
jgi:hypothetical protein